MIENPEVIAAGVAVLIGFVEASRRFQATGTIPLRELPWAAKRELFRALRKSWFTIDKPTNRPSFVVNQPARDVRQTLAEQGFVPEWPLSYRYGGEVLNMRFYFYDPSKTLPNRQIHVRGFEHADGLELMAHEEPTPDHHPKEHLESDDMEYEPANEFVKRRLENERHIGYPS